MNKYHQLAIELKYGGMNYKQISKKLDGKFTSGTLKKYFSRNGKLYNKYINYADGQNEIRRQETSILIRKATTEAAQAILTTLREALKGNDSRIVLKSAQMILDRAGMPTPRWTSKDVVKEKGRKVLSDEEYESQLRAQGLDPRTGRRIGVPPPSQKTPDKLTN